MKRVLWMIVALSTQGRELYGYTYLPGDTTTLVPYQDSRERGIQQGCFAFVPGSDGYDVLQVSNDGQRCGWIEIQVKTASTYGDQNGWNGFVKLVNAHQPEKQFYLGSVAPTRQLNFQGVKTIACYVCKGPTNCNPNAVNNDCFVPGINQIDCSKQVNCSDVVMVNQCYRKNDTDASLSPQFYFNDLDLCPSFPRDLQNYSGMGTGSFQSIDVSKVQPAPSYQPALHPDVITVGSSQPTKTLLATSCPQCTEPGRGGVNTPAS